MSGPTSFGLSGLTVRTSCESEVGFRNGAPARRSSRGAHIGAGRVAGGEIATPRWIGSTGTGCCFQISASSPSTSCEARTGSPSRSVRANNAWMLGSGSTRVGPAAVGTVGAGASDPCHPDRSTVSASPSTISVEVPASQSRVSSSSCPSAGRVMNGLGLGCRLGCRFPRTSLPAARWAISWVSSEVPSPNRCGDHGRQVRIAERGGHRLDVLRVGGDLAQMPRKRAASCAGAASLATCVPSAFR